MVQKDKLVVLVTCGSAEEAKRIARKVVEARLAACANVLSAQVHSTYRWKGRVETSREVLVLIKTSRSRLLALRAAVKKLHSYDVPEFIALPIVAASTEYLRWLDECLRRDHKVPRRKSTTR